MPSPPPDWAVRRIWPPELFIITAYRAVWEPSHPRSILPRSTAAGSVKSAKRGIKSTARSYGQGFAGSRGPGRSVDTPEPPSKASGDVPFLAAMLLYLGPGK
ncbi:hypothetical protein VUR80DRAFT_3483 [Thermomyces stellatus]